MGLALELARAARDAAPDIAAAPAEVRSSAIRAAAALLRGHADAIVAANGRDMARAKESGMSEGLLDRLMLDDARVCSIADAMDEVASQPDPLGKVVGGHVNANGLRIQKVTVPLGVVAMIYEARPNVTADAFALCLRAGNACLLKGGSAANETCTAIADVCRKACDDCGLPADAVSYVEDDAEHTQTAELLGAGLIRACVEGARVPTIETGTGNCHIYVHESADLARARAIVMNAKTQRVGVCNAAESLLVDEDVADSFLPEMLDELAGAGVLIHSDARSRGLASDAALSSFVDASEDDWGREYLALEISVRVVSGLEEAIDHINRYGTRHSESIVTESYAASERFLARVDAACVYVNASTRFTDGGVFGLGGEIGISTQKLHARGPMGAEALTTTKFQIRGDGQVR